MENTPEFAEEAAEVMTTIRELGGRGIVLRSLWDVRPLLESGQLQQVLPDVTQPANVWAVYPARLASSAKVRVCVDFLADEFAQWNLPAP